MNQKYNEDYGFVIEDIIEEIIEEQLEKNNPVIRIDDILLLISDYLNLSKFEVFKFLRKIKSKYADGTNYIVGYLYGNPVKRTNLITTCTNIEKKIKNKLERKEQQTSLFQNL